MRIAKMAIAVGAGCAGLMVCVAAMNNAGVHQAGKPQVDTSGIDRVARPGPGGGIDHVVTAPPRNVPPVDAGTGASVVIVFDAKPLTKAELAAQKRREAEDDRERARQVREAEKEEREDDETRRQMYARTLEQQLIDGGMSVIVRAQGQWKSTLYIKTYGCSDVFVNGFTKRDAFAELQPKLQFWRVLCESPATGNTAWVTYPDYKPK